MKVISRGQREPTMKISSKYTIFILLGIFTGCAQTGPALNSMKAELPPPTPESVVEEVVLKETQDVAPTAKEGESEITSNMISPLVEKRETIVATGYAVISVQNHDNSSQQRLLAIRASKLEAYRSLAEQVYGQYLDATTTIADMVVMSDTFRSRVEGVIYGATVISITPVGDDTYETTLSLDRTVVNDLRILYLNYLARRNA